MNRIHTFESYTQEVNEAAKVENYAGRKNTFYWGDKGLMYQIPYIFPGEYEDLPAGLLNNAYFEGEARKSAYAIVAKANDEMNKEVEKAQVAIKKLGDDAVKEITKIYDAWSKEFDALKYWSDYEKPTSTVGVEPWMSKEAKSLPEVQKLTAEVFNWWVENGEESKPSQADAKKILDLATRYFNTFRKINGHIIDAMFSQETV